jgi:thioredoxin 1
MGFPTLHLFRDGEVVQQIVGAKSKRVLLALLDDHL